MPPDSDTDGADQVYTLYKEPEVLTGPAHEWVTLDEDLPTSEEAKRYVAMGRRLMNMGPVTPFSPYSESAPRKEVSMQLTIRGKSALKLRSIERFAVKAAYGYSDVFEMSYGLTKTGLRIRRGQEQATLTFNAEKTLLRIKIKFKKEPSNGFRGAIVGYFGVLVHALKNGQFEFDIVPEETQLPNLEVVQDWGRWAYTKLHEADPKGMPKLIGS